MRRIIYLSLAMLAFSQGAWAKPSKTKTPVPTPTKTATPTATTVATPTKTKKPRWIPWPEISDQARLIQYSINTIYSEQRTGTALAYPLIDLTMKRKIDENSVSAEGKLRFSNAASTTDSANLLEVRTAKITLAESWFAGSIGRMDLSDQISTTSFFGRYPLMGIRRQVGAELYLPIRFFLGIEDYKSASSPPTALSFFYFPNIFNSINSSIDGSEGYFLGQARVRTHFLKKFNTVLLFNYGKTKSDYFDYSSVNGRGSYSACFDITYSKNYSVYGEYGVENTHFASTTNVFAYGIKMQRLITLGPLSADEIVFEIQQPMGTSLNNPFTGGNGIVPDLAETPSSAFYCKIKMRIKAVFIEAHLTNSRNDYTFQRMGPLAANKLIPVPFGPGNETDDLEIPFSSTSYRSTAFLLRVGVLF